MYGNLPGIQLCQDRRVAWHLFGMGNEVDIHSAYFHGNTLLDRGHRTDVLSLFPATFVTAEMIPRSTGRWLLTCQVNHHLKGKEAELWPLCLHVYSGLAEMLTWVTPFWCQGQDVTSLRGIYYIPCTPCPWSSVETDKFTQQTSYRADT